MNFLVKGGRNQIIRTLTPVSDICALSAIEGLRMNGKTVEFIHDEVGNAQKVDSVDFFNAFRFTLIRIPDDLFIRYLTGYITISRLEKILTEREKNESNRNY